MCVRSASGSFRSRMQPSRGVRRGVVTRAAAAADVPADEGPSMTKNLSLAFDSSCRVRPSRRFTKRLHGLPTGVREDVLIYIATGRVHGYIPQVTADEPGERTSAAKS
jgi:hypothetical protein